MKPYRLAHLSGLSILALVLLAACSTVAAPASPTPQVEADVTISSASMSFDEATLTVPADRPFSLRYVNRTPMPHNVAIYTDSSFRQKHFAGEVIGEGSVVYEVPAIAAGEYFFRCDLHPEMAGNVISR